MSKSREGFVWARIERQDTDSWLEVYIPIFPGFRAKKVGELVDAYVDQLFPGFEVVTYQVPDSMKAEWLSL